MHFYRKRRGFTLAELACVMGIAGVIAGLMGVAGLHAKRASDRHSAEAQVVTLESAIGSFHAKRGAMPRDLDGDGITTTDEIVKQLKEWGMLKDDFCPVDPWGKPYVIVLKRDYEISAYTMRDLNFFPLNDVTDGVQIYSAGPDGAMGSYDFEDETQDDIANFGA